MEVQVTSLGKPRNFKMYKPAGFRKIHSKVPFTTFLMLQKEAMDNPLIQKWKMIKGTFIVF